jgi:hypothetical protein
MESDDPEGIKDRKDEPCFTGDLPQRHSAAGNQDDAAKQCEKLVPRNAGWNGLPLQCEIAHQQGDDAKSDGAERIGQRIPVNLLAHP